MILPAPNAPLGSVASLPRYSPSDFPASSAILCRNTAPLLDFAFNLLACGTACHIVGKDIQLGLVKLIERIGGSSMTEFKMNLVRHRDTEVARLRRKGKREAAENYEDKCQALFAIMAHSATIAEGQGRLASIFSSGDGVTLSTIHLAKGLEWERVFLLDWHLLPSSYAESEDALRQEKNLQYVAVTRAKLDIRFIKTGCFAANTNEK